MTVFLRLMEAEDKVAGLLRGVRDTAAPERFEVEPKEFAKVPGSPFAYWVSDSIRMLFTALPAFESRSRTAKRGPSTCDDYRYLRCYWEVVLDSFHGLGIWQPYAKGGAFSLYYADVYLCVDWEPRRNTFLGFFGRPGREIARLESCEYFFRPGLTWPRRTNGLSFRVLPPCCIFADKGPAVFVDEDEPTEILSLAALMNSQAFGYLVSLQLARTELAQSYEVGLIQQTPVSAFDSIATAQLSSLARHAWILKRMFDTVNETSHAFVLPSQIRARVSAYDPITIAGELGAIQRAIDDFAFKLYGIYGNDRAQIEQWAGNRSTEVILNAEASELEGNVEKQITDDRDSLLSWSIGVAFNRFDIRLATGEREAPPEPEPFDPLPAKSPGMLPDGAAPFHPNSGILVDDPGHSNDLTSLMFSVLEHVEQPVPENLRAWIAKEFFPLHIKMYSKSRRKAPIYWQLATSSASYSVWLYIHAFSDDTLYSVQNDYIAPKLQHEERKLGSMRTEYGGSPTASQRKELAAQQAFVEELRALLEEVKRIAPLWKPNLDDGVIINFAPFWRLVPQNKSWQKEAKRTWDELCAGKYDWAHLAMHLWPERVVPQCATDRSFAIAHGLEDIFWVGGRDGKWQKRPEPTRPIEAIVQERTSTAVKSALNSLLTAPVASAGKRTRRTAESLHGEPD